MPRTFSVPLDSNTPSRFVSGTYTAAAEVLLDIGMLDFGKGVTAKANVAVCRTRGDEKQLVGEFAYQCKFKRRDERTPSCGDEALRAILLLAATSRAGLGLPQHDQDRSSLSSQRQSSTGPRIALLPSPLLMRLRRVGGR